MNVIAGHNSMRGAFSHELCDRPERRRHLRHRNRALADRRRLRGKALPIVGITAPEQCGERPAFADRWNVERHEAGVGTGSD